MEEEHPVQEIQQQASDFVAEVYSPQLAKKMKRPPQVASAAAPRKRVQSQAQGGSATGGRLVTDTLLRWNALPNEFIVPIGRPDAEPVLGGSVSKLWARGVLRFPSSVQRIEFRTDNISNENQGVLVEGWACWRVSNPKKAVEKLDFSEMGDPMANTSKILAIQCAGIMKGLISIKNVADLLKRREDLIDKLREKLQPTEEQWGISFDEIGISEVQVLSQDVFENLQRPFRNEAREVAATSDLDTEERIAEKQATQKERVATIEAENARKLREMEARNKTQIKNVEVEEEEKRIRAEKEVKNLRLEEEHRLQVMEEELQAEARKNAELAAIAAEEERRIRSLRAEESEEREKLRLKTEREAAVLEAEKTIQANRKEAELLRIEVEKELAAARAAQAAEKRKADAEARREEAAVEAEIQRTKLAVHTEREETRIEMAGKEREVEGRRSPAELRLAMIQSLPEIASHMPVGDVRWYGGGNGSDSGPLGLVGRAVDELFEVASTHGIDLKQWNRSGEEDTPEN